MSEILENQSIKKLHYIAIFVIILATILPYSSSFHNSFHFDDRSKIKKLSESYHGKLNWEFFKVALNLSNKPIIYRPIAGITLAINYHFGKNSVLGYHIVNLSIHLITALILYLFLFHTLIIENNPVFFKNHAFGIAFIGTLLWAIHPIQTQAVTYIIQRMTLLAGLFSILSMYLYLMFKKTGNKLLLLFMILSILLAFGSKENTIFIPLLILLYEWLFFQKADIKFFCRKRVILILLAIGFLLFLLGIFLEGISLFKNLFYQFISNRVPGRDFTLKERLLTQLRVVLFYLSLIIYPNLERFNIDHDFIISKSIINPISTLFSAILILFLITWAWKIKKRYPFITWSIYWYFLNLLVESSIIGLEMVFEHRAYLPSMMVFPVIAMGLIRIGQLSLLVRYPIIFRSIIIIIMIILGGSTFLRNRVWRDPVTLWSDSVKKSPLKARCYNNLGSALSEIGKKYEAMEMFKKALSLQPDYFYAHYNLAMRYEELGLYQKALHHLWIASKLKPKKAITYRKIALIYLNMGRLKLAEKEFLMALRYKKDDVEAMNNLSLIYYYQGRYQEAITNLQKALHIRPDLWKIRLNLGLVYKKIKVYKKALQLLEEASKHSKSLLLKLHIIELYKNIGSNKWKRMYIEVSSEWKARGITPKDIWRKYLEPIENKRKYISPLRDLDFNFWHNLLFSNMSLFD